MNHPEGRLVSIYCLKDPESGDVRYVGWSIDPRSRLKSHIKVAKNGRENNHRTNWIKSLLRRGAVPVLEVLETGIIDFTSAERAWISHFREMGCNLTNGTDGGEGMLGFRPSAETKEKIASALRGRPGNKGAVIEEWHKARVAEANRKRVWTAEQKAALSARRKGRSTSEEHRKHLSEALKGRKAGAFVPWSAKRRQRFEEKRAAQTRTLQLALELFE